MSDVSIVVPDLGEQIARVRVVRWFCDVGAVIEADEPVVAISTDKIDVDLTAPVTGTVVAIHAREGEWVTIGAILGAIAPQSSAPRE